MKTKEIRFLSQIAENSISATLRRKRTPLISLNNGLNRPPLLLSPLNP